MLNFRISCSSDCNLDGLSKELDVPRVDPRHGGPARFHQVAVVLFHHVHLSLSESCIRKHSDLFNDVIPVSRTLNLLQLFLQ